MTPKASILIVDDEPKICEFLGVLLRREGYAASAVHNAADALAQAQAQRYDLVLTDLKMPGMDGFELVSRLKALRRDLPIIMITGYATVDTAVKALRHGVNDYVTKPFNIDELRKVVARTLEAAGARQEDGRLAEELQQANADLARQRKQLAEQVQVFSALGEMLSDGQDLAPLLGKLVATLRDRLRARRVSIMLREGDDLVVSACDDARAALLTGRRQGVHEGVAGIVIREQKILRVDDARADARVRPSEDRGYAGAAFLCVPLLHDNKALGVVCVTDKEDASVFLETEARLVAEGIAPAASAVEKASLYRNLERRCMGVIEALVTTIESRDRYTNGHSRRVTDYAIALAQEIGATPQEIDTLQRAARLHDIGKLGVSEQILHKPAHLTDDERKAVQCHPTAGEKMVEPLEFLRAVRPLIRHHHERMDGWGYPDSLPGEAIPRMARVLAIADAFDAMTSDRPYRRAMSHADAAAALRAGAGRQFDREFAEIFCDRVLNRFPDTGKRGQ